MKIKESKSQYVLLETISVGEVFTTEGMQYMVCNPATKQEPEHVRVVHLETGDIKSFECDEEVIHEENAILDLGN